jgi:hypothetical protein
MLLNKDEVAALKKKSESEEAMSPGGKAMDFAGSVPRSPADLARGRGREAGPGREGRRGGKREHAGGSRRERERRTDEAGRSLLRVVIVTLH